ncbi:MAG: DUF5060 domain-containing protein [Acidobacteriaceae bacterium]|nr:DUF5060 domain-containing protein [Acidobacteriaceae bacterium]MBV9778973.1 DUF5060 domain-containing protein [Acidobacteriaceae bacterium]
MRSSGRCAATILFTLIVCTPRATSASIASCSQGARAFSPCELSFDWHEGELSPTASPYRDELLNIEFRSPRATTYLMRAFWDGGHTLRVRFSPTEPGAWTYHVSSLIKRYDNQEFSFTVADSTSPGFVDIANVRHWKSTNKQPHLWLSAAAPFLEIDQASFETWLDHRKHDGFTHVRGPLFTLHYREKPLSEKSQPNLAYFAALDDRLIAADNRGLTLDLLIADESFSQSGILANPDQRNPLMRYLIARYGGLNVTWQGLAHFEDVTDARMLLKELGASLEKYDAFRHPRSTDARASSFPLLSDGWMNYLIEASPHPELGAVEHQFTAAPEIHIINATEPDAFRHELWNLTTNAEYPSVSYEALKNEANVRAIQTWVKVISDTRHWELEPYFDVDGARAAGLEEVEYLAYAQTPGIVEITLPKHKYNPLWVDPITGEEIPLKDYKGEVFSRQTPDASHDWVLQVPREGKKEHMLHSYYFESQDPPVQEIESDPAKIPFQILDPPGDTISVRIPAPFSIKMTKANRATRLMQFVWWGEIVPGDRGVRLLGAGPSGTFSVPQELIQPGSESLNIRLFAINANGKAYELDKVYRLSY